MKFQCDRCKTRYSIADEKIRGKVLKIRCKNCSSIITVKEDMDKDAAGSEPPAPPPSGPGKAAGGAAGAKPPAPSPALEQAFQRAMSRLPMPPPLTNVGDDDEDEGATVAAGPAASAASAASAGASAVEDEWFVSIDGNQEGPFTLAEARRRVGRKKPDEEMFAWRDGFDDWLPVEKVPDLALHVPARRAPAPPPPAPPAPPAAIAARPPPSPVTPPPSISSLAAAAPAAGAAAVEAETADDADESPFSLSALAASGAAPSTDGGGEDGGDFDFQIGEASRVVKLNDLGGAIAAAAGIGAASAGLPGMGANGRGAALAARGSGAAQAVSAGAIEGDANVSAAVLVAGAPRRLSGAVVAIAGGATACVLAGLLIFLFTRKSGADVDDTGSSSAVQRSEALQGGEFGGTRFVVVNRDPGGSGASSDPSKGGGTRPGGGIRPPGPRPPGAGGTPVGTSTTGGTPGTNGSGVVVNPGADLKQPTGEGPLTALTAEDFLSVYSKQQAGLRWCYERALKQNPDLKVGTVDVTVTIAATGKVTKIDIAGGEPSLNACLKQKIGAWSFRKSTGDFTTRLPLVFRQ